MNCLISAGPTREWIDPVRFISNPSSGKMGYALASAALEKGMKVRLVSGPVTLVPPKGVEIIHVETAFQMMGAMLQFSMEADLIIMNAAVSDHRPKITSKKKISKKTFPENLLLESNPDILKTLGKRKPQNQILVGFAAETHDILNSAQKKLVDKNLDWLVVNDVSNPQIGFCADQNEVFIIGRNGQEERIYLAEKSKIAKKILNVISSSWLKKAH